MGEIIQINDKTWRIEDGLVRFYLFCGTEKAALIDSGMDTPDARGIAESLTDLPLILINTHADGDHTSGNGAFEEIYMSPAEEEHYRADNGKGILLPVKEGDIIELGGRPLRIIDIPGHTPGSIAILDDVNRILVSGDTVQDDKIFMFGERRELDRFAASLEHLMEYIDYFDEIYPMHGTFPVKPDLITKLISGVQDILSGQAAGTPGMMFGTEVTRYIFPYAEILCDKVFAFSPTSL